jgi:hypothetical protein
MFLNCDYDRVLAELLDAGPELATASIKHREEVAATES